jgi:hypothetical protein
VTRRRKLLLAVWIAPSAVFLAVTALAYGTFRITPPDRLDAAARAAVIAPLRAAIEQRTAPCTAPGPIPGGGPLIATVWLDGRSLVRVEAHGDTLAAAADDAARQLRVLGQISRMTALDRDRARVQVDLVEGRAPLAGTGGVFDTVALPGVASSLALNPGIEGIGASVTGHDDVLMLPHELVTAKLLSSQRPSSALPDLAMGTDMHQIESMVRKRVGTLPNGRLDPDVHPATLFRFRTDAFVERPVATRSQPPLPLTRGQPPPPPVSGASLRSAALLGARYLVDHLAKNGRYAYEHDLSTGHQTDALRLGTAYSMPRHAGVTYFLAQTYRITHEEWLREPIERAFQHLSDLIAAGNCGTTLPDGTAIDCVLDHGETTAQLGSTALTVVALAEYQRATGDTRYLPLATKLSAFILYMQRPDGSFRHVYDPKTHTPDESQMLLYYSGEASLALSRMWVVTQDPRYGDAAVRGLDWLVDWYDFFLGGFFYGEEHWTCISAEAIYAYPPAQKDKYREFCDGYGAFLRQQQSAVGDLPDEDDLAGAYNVTPFVLPFNTPAGSRTEAMISAYLLGEHHGHGDPRIREQIRATLGYVIGQQLRPDSDFSVVGAADGGMPGSPIERNVRIDFVQHTCSAMIRASEWIDSPAP